jgi:hypothetical protein
MEKKPKPANQIAAAMLARLWPEMQQDIANGERNADRLLRAALAREAEALR